MTHTTVAHVDYVADPDESLMENLAGAFRSAVVDGVEAESIIHVASTANEQNIRVIRVTFITTFETKA